MCFYSLPLETRHTVDWPASVYHNINAVTITADDGRGYNIIIIIISGIIAEGAEKP